MHVIFNVPMLGISQHFGMTVGEFTTKHLRLGSYIFDIMPGCRRFVPQAMCLLEEYTDAEWAKMEKSRAAEVAAAAEAKAKAEAAEKEANEKAALEAKKLTSRIKKFLRMK